MLVWLLGETMPKKSKVLSALEVKRLSEPGFHSVGEVDGLHLRVTPAGARSWILRYATGENRYAKSGKPYKVRRDMGLGSYPSVTLAQARDKARLVREKLDSGVDPVTERKASSQARTVETDSVQLGPEKALALTLHRVNAHHMEPSSGFTISSTLSRFACPLWWRRQLRRLTRRRREQRQRILDRT